MLLQICRSYFDIRPESSPLMLSYLQAAVIGLLQGVTEMFPVSSLGHSVLVPAFLGGSWEHLVTESSTSASETSPYLAFIVALHVATALALIIFFRADWARIIAGLTRTVRPSLAAGITGLLFEHAFRTLFAKPLAAAILLTINGLILLAGEWFRRRAPVDSDDSIQDAGPVSGTPAGGLTTKASERTSRRLAALHYREASIIGFVQTSALLAGISRSGVTMVGGLVRGLSHRDAARFSFLLATPVILAAGVLKLPTLAGSAAAHIHGPVILGAVVAGVAAYVSVRWLTRYFETRTLTPFAIYCLVVGVICIIRFA
jgi:undecaprenyl-diphosphatase